MLTSGEYAPESAEAEARALPCKGVRALAGQHDGDFA